MAPDPSPDPLLIPARLAVGEAQDHRSRLLGLMDKPGPRVIDFTEADGCTHPSAVSLQLCLAVAAEVAATGTPAQFGPEATRLLAIQKLL